ncbi:MAG: alpha/beta fold hydrolase [Pseudonocardia sp.]
MLVAGQSWGGNIAMQLAVDHPALVAGLVLVDGGGCTSATTGPTWTRPGAPWPRRT